MRVGGNAGKGKSQNWQDPRLGLTMEGPMPTLHPLAPGWALEESHLCPSSLM